METIGLMPSNTGKLGGKRTGQQMTHYIIKNGKYEQAFKAMPNTFTLPFTSLDGDRMKSLMGGKSGVDGKTSPLSTKPTKNKNKTKYSCSNCKVNVWGKSGLNIQCMDCGVLFLVVG